MEEEQIFVCESCGKELYSDEVDSRYGHVTWLPDKNGEPQQCLCGPCNIKTDWAMKRIRELEKDSKRIDWLEKEANECGGILIHDGSESIRRKGIGLRGRSIREAVDAVINI